MRGVKMEKKFKASEINLKIDNTIPFYNDNFAGLIIEWSSDIGFGQYEIYFYNFDILVYNSFPNLTC